MVSQHIHSTVKAVSSAAAIGRLFYSMHCKTQASAGKLLRVFTNWSVGRITYVTQLQLTMAVVMTFGCIVLALHGYIARAFPSNAAEINPKVIAKAQRLAQRKERQHSGRSSSGGQLSAHCKLRPHPCIQQSTEVSAPTAGGLMLLQLRSGRRMRGGVTTPLQLHPSPSGIAGSGKRSDGSASRGSRDSVDAAGSHSFDSADGSLSDSLDAADAGKQAYRCSAESLRQALQSCETRSDGIVEVYTHVSAALTVT